ncbi:hypothetical protein CABS01_00454 [Colletotrichum abscissum]|uniref:uncharacterized protein n=1 Tax=Colletotrichum abscissum TaxID=1671311 RepID=UPI0027D63D51|nr:uncharacterized protein CABS01_00454 [Colletotrichum abscissum]KAK1525365.1 hypothetical protein CABS01_00454 [Colletotrichum abscissum]
MTKPRRSERLSQHVQQVIIARAVDGTPAQNELSGCVTPNEVYLHAPKNETRDTSYDVGVNAPLHDPVLDTIYAYPYGFGPAAMSGFPPYDLSDRDVEFRDKSYRA